MILNLIKLAVKKKSGLEKLIHAQIEFDPAKESCLLKCEGSKAGKIEKFQGTLSNDPDVSTLRNLFIKQAGKIPGKVTFVKATFDYLNARSEVKTYYIDSTTGEKQFKAFSL